MTAHTREKIYEVSRTRFTDEEILLWGIGILIRCPNCLHAGPGGMKFCMNCAAFFRLQEEVEFTALAAAYIPTVRASTHGLRTSSVRSDEGTFWNQVRANMKWRAAWSDTPFGGQGL